MKNKLFKLNFNKIKNYKNWNYYNNLNNYIYNHKYSFLIIQGRVINYNHFGIKIKVI